MCVRACVCVCVCVFVEQVNIFRFLGIIITENLSWPSQITALIKKKKKKGRLNSLVPIYQVSMILVR